MRPGRYSSVGFLGPAESLEAVLAQNAATISELGLSFDEVAQALQTIVQKARDQFGDVVRIGRLEALIPSVALGHQICPWGPDRGNQICSFADSLHYSNFEWLLRDFDTGEMMAGPGLIVHLIRHHRFFEGMDSPFRVDPKRLARLLRLGPLRS